jgi:hypothetical protein
MMDCLGRTLQTILPSVPSDRFPIPKFDSTKAKFILTPATYNKVQAMLKHILTVENVPAEVVTKMTLRGLRLWAAEMAYHTKGPQEVRKYIGHLSQVETVDTYAREHASIITKTWDHIFQEYNTATPRQHFP